MRLGERDIIEVIRSMNAINRLTGHRVISRVSLLYQQNQEATIEKECVYSEVSLVESLMLRSFHSQTYNLSHLFCSLGHCTIFVLLDSNILVTSFFLQFEPVEDTTETFVDASCKYIYYCLIKLNFHWALPRGIVSQGLLFSLLSSLLWSLEKF